MDKYIKQLFSEIRQHQRKIVLLTKRNKLDESYDDPGFMWNFADHSAEQTIPSRP